MQRHLESLLKSRAKVNLESKPVLLSLKRSQDRRAMERLLRDRSIRFASDDYEEELREFFAVTHPTLVYSGKFEAAFEEYYRDLKTRMPVAQYGTWAYFPWLSTVSHILPEKDFQLVRTARNRNLITKDEQDKFYHATIGIGGLSVGSSVALAIVLQGGGRHIRLADHDRLALSNTNRVRAGVQNLGLLKVEMAARQIYEMNPYARVEVFPEGITKKNIGKFFDGLDIVIDELDNLAVKYLIREQAKKHKIAVVMGADNGDNAVVDIERYDVNPKTPFFHGRMGKVSYDMLSRLDKFGIGKMITKHVGPENVTERMRASLLEMGKTIVSWPQLGGAAMLNGAAVAYCVRKILNRQSLESNRGLIILDEKLVPGYNSVQQKKRRLKTANEFKKLFGL